MTARRWRGALLAAAVEAGMTLVPAFARADCGGTALRLLRDNGLASQSDSPLAVAGLAIPGLSGTPTRNETGPIRLTTQTSRQRAQSELQRAVVASRAHERGGCEAHLAAARRLLD